MLFMVRCATVLAVIFALTGLAHAQGAKLPPEYINENRALTSLAIDETAYISLFGVYASKDGEIFLFPKTPIFREQGSFSLRITRRSDGYHMYLSKNNRSSFRVSSDNLSSDELLELGYIPVKEIHIEP